MALTKASLQPAPAEDAPDGHPDLAKVLGNYATVRGEPGRADEAEAGLQRIRQAEAQAGSQP